MESRGKQREPFQQPLRTAVASHKQRSVFPVNQPVTIAILDK
jgi:hypothetical protein